MVNYKIQLIAVAMLITMACSAAEIENKIDKAKYGMAQSYMNLSEFQNAEPLLKQLREKYPDDEEILINYLVILTEKQEYQTAIKNCEDYLETSQQNTKILLWLARCLSWNKQYDKSIDVYSDLITQYPDWQLPVREKARVLGWSRNFSEAIYEYQTLAERLPADSVLNYEMHAKRSLYNQFPAAAINYYNKWLEEEPDNPEAMYDLAQVYSTQEMWSKAEEIYERILEQYSGHFRARQALEKVRMYSHDSKAQAGFLFFESDSSGRLTDSKYWDTFASLTVHLDGNTSMTARQDNVWRSFDDHDQIYQQQFGVELQYKRKPDLWGNFHITSNTYDSQKGVEYLFGGDVNFRPVDEWTLSVSHNRRQIIDNAKVFFDKLYSDDFKARLLFQPTRKWIAGADYLYSDYSDNNHKDMYGADLGYYLSFEPDSIKISYRYEIYHFNRNDLYYFSPESFHSNKLQSEWRHYFNSEELYWGSNDTYTTVQYDLIFDDGQHVGHQLKIKLNHDWNDTSNIGIEWSKTIYEHREIYSQDLLMLVLSMYF